MSVTIESCLNDEPMRCLEVWGGNGPAESDFQRPGLDIWIRSHSTDATAGGSDLYMVSSCASGRITRTMLADICAYGSLFFDTASALRRLMKQNINTIQQSRLVRQLSRRLEESSHDGCYATAMISTYFAPTRAFTLCNAGHPPPLVYRARKRQWSYARSATPSQCENSSSPGVIDHSAYQQLRTTLDVGDLVVCYSNSLTECRSQDGKIVGLDGLIARIDQHDAGEPSAIAGALLDDLKAEDPDNLAFDAATVVVYRATNRRVSWQDNLLAPMRLFWKASDKTRFE